MRRGDGQGFGNRSDGDRRTRRRFGRSDLPTGSDGDGFGNGHGFGQSADRFGRFAPSCRRRRQGNRRNRSPWQPWRQSRRRGDGFGNRADGDRQQATAPTVTGSPWRSSDGATVPTGATVRRPSRRQVRQPWRQSAATVRRCYRADGDGFAVAIFRPGNGQQAQPPRAPICRHHAADRFAPNPPHPPAVAFPPFGRVRARPDLPPRPVAFLWRSRGDLPTATGQRGNRPTVTPCRSAANGSER